MASMVCRSFLRSPAGGVPPVRVTREGGRQEFLGFSWNELLKACWEALQILPPRIMQHQAPFTSIDGSRGTMVLGRNLLNGHATAAHPEQIHAFELQF